MFALSLHALRSPPGLTVTRSWAIGWFVLVLVQIVTMHRTKVRAMRPPRNQFA